jgi:hypothetical protein
MSSKTIMVLMLHEGAVDSLPADKVEANRRGAIRLKAFQRRLRREGYVRLVSEMALFKQVIKEEVPRWIAARPLPTGGWVPANQLHKMREQWELERSYRNVYTYLFDRLNPYDNLFTQDVLRTLTTVRLAAISDVTHVLEELIKCYVDKIIPTGIRVYFAYSLTASHMTERWVDARNDDPLRAIYRFGITNSKDGNWMQGVEVTGLSNLHNVYSRGEIRGIADSKLPSGDPDHMNQPISDEGSVIAAPVLYGRDASSVRDRYSVGVVGLNSPERNEAPKHRAFVRELSILFSSLFFAYGQEEHKRQPSGDISEEQMAQNIRRELVDCLGGTWRRLDATREISPEDLVTEVPGAQQVAFRDSLNTHLLDRIAAAVPVEWLITLFYFDVPDDGIRKFVKVQTIAFSGEARGRVEVRGRAVNSVGSVPAPNKRAYHYGPRAASWCDQSEKTSGRYEIDVCPRDVLAFAVGYKGAVNESVMTTAAGKVARDWLCVEVEDLAERGAINCFLATSAAAQTMAFQSECEFFMDGGRPRFVRVPNTGGTLLDLPAHNRRHAEEVAIQAAKDLPEYATAFEGLARALASPTRWAVDCRRSQRHDLAYVVQFSDVTAAS